MAYKLYMENLVEELMSFRSSYTDGGDADGNSFICDEDYNNFIAEQISHFTSTLLNNLEKIDGTDFDYLVQVLGGFISDVESESYFTCPHCGKDIYRYVYEFSIGTFCPFCGENVVN